MLMRLQLVLQAVSGFLETDQALTELFCCCDLTGNLLFGSLMICCKLCKGNTLSCTFLVEMKHRNVQCCSETYPMAANVQDHGGLCCHMQLQVMYVPYTDDDCSQTTCVG